MNLVGVNTHKRMPSSCHARYSYTGFGLLCVMRMVCSSASSRSSGRLSTRWMM